MSNRMNIPPARTLDQANAERDDWIDRAVRFSDMATENEGEVLPLWLWAVLMVDVALVSLFFFLRS